MLTFDPKSIIFILENEVRNMVDKILDTIKLSLAKILGADEEPSTQQLALYIPNKDKNGNKIKKLDAWIKRARALLTIIGGGATSLPPADGSWLIPQKNDKDISSLRDEDIIWEKTTIVYTYIKADNFLDNLKSLREFLHCFGRESNQGEIVFEFDGKFFRISNFDKK